MIRLPDEPDKAERSTYIRLDPKHHSYLEQRAVGAEFAAMTGLCSVDAHEASHLLGYPTTHGGLAIPYAGVNPPYWRVRLDREEDPRFLAPQNREVPLYVPPVFSGGEDSGSLVIVEGPIKALALAAHGLHAVGLGGTGTTLTPGPSRLLNNSWQRVRLTDRRVIILFDSNRSTNLNVARDEARLAMALERAGADVLIARIPP